MTALPEKLPPQSIEAEACLLGSLMLDGNNAAMWAEISATVRRDHFYRDDHATIFDQLLDIRRRGVPIDAVSIVDGLKQTGKLDEVGGVVYLGTLMNSTPSAAHATHYAKIVREKAVGRSVIRIATDALRDAYAPHGADYPSIANVYAAKFARLASIGSTQTIRRLGEVALDWYYEVTSGKPPALIQTGFTELDDCIGGLPIGGFSQIWGRPGMGKSALAKAMALRLAEAGTPIGIVSIEENARKIATNAISGVANIQSWKIQHGKLAADDLTAAMAGIDRLFRWPIHIADTPVKMSEVESCVTLLVQRHGCRVVFVDHLHIIDGETPAHANRTAEVTKISGAVKSIGKRLGIAIVGCCQLNRGQSRDDYASKPQLRDARDSGALEQDGDLIIGVFREDWNRQQRNDPSRDGQMLAIVLKNKFGPCGEIPLAWEGDYQRVTEWAGPTP